MAYNTRPMPLNRAWAFRLRFLPAVLYYGVIFILSAQSRLPIRAPFRFFDKVAHFAEFAVLGALLIWAFSSASRLAPGVRAGAAVALAACGGVADEIHQLFVPGRSADVWDALADMLGAAAGVFIVRMALERKRGRSNR